MEKIVVSKSDLKRQLEHNLEGHRELYEKALAGYKKQAADELHAAIDRLAKGEVFAVRLYLAAPEDHTKDYERVIAMLDWHNDSEWTLSETEFAQYVQDDWGWKEQWLLSNSGYTS